MTHTDGRDTATAMLRLTGLWRTHVLPAGSTVLRFVFHSHGKVDSPGLDWKVWLQAAVLTGIVFTVLNTFLMWSVRRSYHTADLRNLNEARSTEAAMQQVEELTGASPGVAKHIVQRAFRERTTGKPARNYILDLVRVVQQVEEVSAPIVKTLDDRMTGHLHGLRAFALQTEGVTGQAVVAAMRDADPAWEHKLASLDEGGSGGQAGHAAEEFLVKFIDRVALESRPQLRNLMRINGWIQWLTVNVCCVVLLLVLSRAMLLARLQNDGWFPGSHSTALSRFLVALEPPPTGKPSSGSAGELAAAVSIESMLDRQVYQTFEFLVALLPSMGFIGTVLGMGNALLSADSLFTAKDKTLAISTITSHLGFAFDTTLVGLVTGIVAGAAVLSLRFQENSLWLPVEAASPVAEGNGGYLDGTERVKPLQTAAQDAT